VSTLDSAAEICKLAHVLGVPTDRLDALTTVAPDDLRLLRGQIGEALFQADKQHFTKVAALARAVPVAVAAKLTEFVLPPLLAARTAELLEPDRAVEMVARISDRYLADVSAALDPNRAPQVIAKIPADRVATVGAELARRQEWVVMGGFVAHVSRAGLQATVRVLSGEQLLRIGFVLDDVSRLDELTAMLSDAQLDDMLTAADSDDLWRELEDLLDNLAPAQVTRMAVRLAAAPESRAEAVRAAGARGALSPAALAQLLP
jgi:hypothetical protein